MTQFQQIYCLVKLSELDWHQASPGGAQRLAKLTQTKRLELEESHRNQSQFLQTLQEEAAQLQLKITLVPQQEADRIQPGPQDLIMTAGGDGTFLACAQRFSPCLLMGLNSDYKPKAGVGSYGALTNVNKHNLKERLTALAEGRYSVARWSRLQANLNGKSLNRYAVNDIYYGQEISYRTCDLVVEQSGINEEFNCSGLLFCTGMGSHAWHYNAGGSPFSNALEAFGFKVLFPNLKRPLKFHSGILKKEQEVVVIPERDGYVLSFDSGLDVIQTEMGDEIRISLAPDQAIRVLNFD